MKEIPLTKGKVALVDDDDFEWLYQYSWCYSEKVFGCKYGYALRGFKQNRKTKLVKMHREIMKAPAGIQVDHIDGDKLNNQRSNLRLCTHGENCRNRISTGASGFKGVFWFAPDSRWRAMFKMNRKIKLVGYFKDARDAAIAYDEAITKAFGEFARTNKSMGLL